ncbi:hypothetical protein MHH56_03515 [Paenibacillus sp. FSL K6-3182]|uniref:hypothetical protein n=1 Tax=Paenibacillus sp. FSL K6-3182 TaxID=2921495 RepID=UPI0030D623F2
MNNFFLLQPFRGKGVAQKAATQVFERFKGQWELFTNPMEQNITGQKFWRKTVSSYTTNHFEEAVGMTFDGHKMVFRFNNADR